MEPSAAEPDCHYRDRHNALKELASAGGLHSLAHSPAYLEFYLAAALVHIGDDVVSVQHLAIQNLQGERILN
jgi:hypothetical protein